MSSSALETGFANLLAMLAPTLPAPEREYRFAPPRLWRFDFAWPTQFVAVELEGGKWTKGRHTRPKGFQADCEKYNAAAIAGWRVLRYTGDDLKGRPVQVVEELGAAINASRN